LTSALARKRKSVQQRKVSSSRWKNNFNLRIKYLKKLVRSLKSERQESERVGSESGVSVEGPSHRW